MATTLHKPFTRETLNDFAHYRRRIVITIVPGSGSGSRPDMFILRLKGTRKKLYLTVPDAYRYAARLHADAQIAAKKLARKNGIPWNKAKKKFAARFEQEVL